MAIKDVEMAIKEQYQRQGKRYSGMVFRGAYVPGNEWIELSQKILVKTMKYMDLCRQVNQRDSSEIPPKHSQGQQQEKYDHNNNSC